MKYYFPLKEIRALCGEMANSRCEQKMLQMNLKYLIIPDSKKTLRLSRAISKGLRSQLEKVPTGQRWDCLSFKKDNNYN